MPESKLMLTKVVATLGPASSELRVIERLIQEGVRVFRLNFSHGTLDEAGERLRLIRDAADACGVTVGVLGDLSGPKIRVEQVRDTDEGGGLDLVPGDVLAFVRSDTETHRRADNVIVVGSTYPEIVDEVQPGQRVLINDGAIRALALEDENRGHYDAQIAPHDTLFCRVTVGGRLTSRKGVNLPDTTVNAPSLTEWDAECAAWSVEHGIDFLALSFVRKAADVVALHDLLKTLGRDNTTPFSGTRLPVIAKIEKPQAIEDLDGILSVSAGVMVARGDLGVEMDLSEVPVLQKRIVRRAHQLGKPVIVATQMLESMINSPTPTRAEVSDVANAIIDGADATMLSGETAVGQYPVLCVATMVKTARQAEAYLSATGVRPSDRPSPQGEGHSRMAALARGVAAVVDELDPRHVVIWTELGGGARYLAHTRLRRPIIAFTSNAAACRQMALLYGVYPVLMPRPRDVSGFIDTLDAWLLQENLANPGDPIVVLTGEPLGVPGVTNNVQVHRVGRVCAV